MVPRGTAFALFLAVAIAAGGCEEKYTECEPGRAPDDFPSFDALAGRSEQCTYVCRHLASLGCSLGCPYLPDGGMDAGLQTSSLDCYDSCVFQATNNVDVDAGGAPVVDVDDATLTRVLRCYAGADTCRQVGACSRLCGDEGARVWPELVLCVEQQQ